MIYVVWVGPEWEHCVFAQIKKRKNVGSVFYSDEGYAFTIQHTQDFRRKKKVQLSLFVFFCVCSDSYRNPNC